MQIQNVLQTAMYAQPEKLDPYFYEGIALLDVGQYYEAIDRFNKASDLKSGARLGDNTCQDILRQWGIPW